MLGKLLKYDIQSVSPILLILHAAALLFSFLGFLVMHILGIQPLDNLLSGLYIAAMLIFICVISFSTTVYLGIYYYRNLYSDEGYLTNTLPVSANSLVLSKFLCGLLWTLIDYLTVFLSVFILLDLGQEISEALRSIGTTIPISMLLICICVFLIDTLVSCLMVYCGVAIGNFFRGHRIMGCIGGYIFLYLINQILALIILIPLFMNPAFSAYANDTILLSEAFALINRGMVFAIIINLTFGIIYYAICVRALDRKLEMD